MPAFDDDFLRRHIDQPVGAPPPYLWVVHSPEEQAEHLDELADWIAWIVGRYGLDHRSIPVCWTQHDELLEELSALHLAWQAAYATLAPGDAPLLWHEHFALARQRLSDWVARTGCRPGEHRP